MRPVISAQPLRASFFALLIFTGAIPGHASSTGRAGFRRDASMPADNFPLANGTSANATTSLASSPPSPVPSQLSSPANITCAELTSMELLSGPDYWRESGAQVKWDEFIDAFSNNKLWCPRYCRGQDVDTPCHEKPRGQCHLGLRDASAVSVGRPNLVQALNLWTNRANPGTAIWCGADQPSCEMPECEALLDPAYYLMRLSIWNIHNRLALMKNNFDIARNDIINVQGVLKKMFGHPPMIDPVLMQSALISGFFTFMGLPSAFASITNPSVAPMMNLLMVELSAGSTLLDGIASSRQGSGQDMVVDDMTADLVFLNSARLARANLNKMSANLFESGSMHGGNGTDLASSDLSRFLKDGGTVDTPQFDSEAYLQQATRYFAMILAKYYWSGDRQQDLPRAFVTYRDGLCSIEGLPWTHHDDATPNPVEAHMGELANEIIVDHGRRKGEVLSFPWGKVSEYDPDTNRCYYLLSALADPSDQYECRFGVASGGYREALEALGLNVSVKDFIDEAVRSKSTARGGPVNPLPLCHWDSTTTLTEGCPDWSQHGCGF